MKAFRVLKRSLPQLTNEHQHEQEQQQERGEHLLQQQQQQQSQEQGQEQQLMHSGRHATLVPCLWRRQESTWPACGSLFLKNPSQVGFCGVSERVGIEVCAYDGWMAALCLPGVNSIQNVACKV